MLKYEFDTHFMDFCSKFDMLGLVETWGTNDNDFTNFLPGYKQFRYFRQKTIGARRGSGGVSVFIRDNVYEHYKIQRIFSNVNEAVILHLQNLETCIKEIVVIFAYVAPENSTIYTYNDTNGIELLQCTVDNVISEYPNASILLAGDLNARTANCLDYIPNDTLSYVFSDKSLDYPTDSFCLSRRSKDEKINNFGHSLLEMCCSFDMYIMNGRLFNDHDGNFTYFSTNGQSVIDYIIASTDLFSYVSYFSVEDIDLPDHFPICYTLSMSKSLQANGSCTCK